MIIEIFSMLASLGLFTIWLFSKREDKEKRKWFLIASVVLYFGIYLLWGYSSFIAILYRLSTLLSIIFFSMWFLKDDEKREKSKTLLIISIIIYVLPKCIIFSWDDVYLIMASAVILGWVLVSKEKNSRLHIILGYLSVMYVFAYLIECSVSAVISGGRFGEFIRLMAMTAIFAVRWVMLANNAEKKKKRILICVVAVMAVIIIMIVIISTIEGSLSSDGGGCDICGRPTFAGNLCEEHFNDFAKRL